MYSLMTDWLDPDQLCTHPDADFVSIVNLHTSLYSLLLIYIDTCPKRDQTLLTSVYKALEDYTISYNFLADIEADLWWPLKTNYGSVKAYARILKQKLNKL